MIYFHSEPKTGALAALKGLSLVKGIRPEALLPFSLITWSSATDLSFSCESPEARAWNVSFSCLSPETRALSGLFLCLCVCVCAWPSAHILGEPRNLLFCCTPFGIARNAKPICFSTRSSRRPQNAKHNRYACEKYLHLFVE